MSLTGKEPEPIGTEIAIIVPCETPEEMKEAGHEIKNRGWEMIQVARASENIWDQVGYLWEEAAAKEKQGIAIRAVSRALFDQIVSWASTKKHLNEIVSTCAGNRWPPVIPLAQADPGYARRLH